MSRETRARIKAAAIEEWEADPPPPPVIGFWMGSARRRE